MDQRPGERFSDKQVDTCLGASHSSVNTTQGIILLHVLFAHHVRPYADSFEPMGHHSLVVIIGRGPGGHIFTTPHNRIILKRRVCPNLGQKSSGLEFQRTVGSGKNDLNKATALRHFDCTPSNTLNFDEAFRNKKWYTIQAFFSSSKR